MRSAVLRSVRWLAVSAALIAVPAQALAAEVADPKAASAMSAPAAEPDNLQEQARILRELYAELAKATTAENAKALENTIERIWAFTGSATVDLLMERAAVALAMEDRALALDLLNRCVKMAPGSAEVWNRRASAYFADSRLVEALGDLNRALAIDPNHFLALQGASVTLRELGQKKRALDVMRQFRKVHPFSDTARQGTDELERELEGRRI